VALRDAYVAIADPTRRDILALLYEQRVLPAGMIAERFSAVSRPAISRHLRILRECGVVVSLKRGKARHYALNADPINRIRTGWMATFADAHLASLRELRRIVERQVD
jgi:DNA-binding transcriptional ArsR family regulator